MVLVVKAQSPNHWRAREFLHEPAYVGEGLGEKEGLLRG